MDYRIALAEESEIVYDIVQRTIKEIYPKYYPREVVDFFCNHHSLDAIKKDVAEGRVSVLVVDNRIVGTGCFVGNHITRVYILPQYQGRGYGIFVMQTIETEIAKNHSKVYLDASLPAAGLYQKLGYRTTQHERYPVENGVILAYEVMEKEIYKVNPDALELYLHKLPDTVYEYRKATWRDLDELVRTRIIVLRAANKLSDAADMELVRQASYEYYQNALASGEHIAYLVYDEEKFIGAGGVSFYQVMPTYHNPSGRKAYIMNMYTAPEYRRQGIALQTLDLLVKEARAQGVTQISLEATEAGRPLYEKYGFVAMKNEMELF